MTLTRHRNNVPADRADGAHLVEQDIVTHETARKGLAVLRIAYGVTFLWAFFDKLLALGFHFFSVDEPSALATWLQHPDNSPLEANVAVARTHFDLRDLPPRISDACATVGWDEW